jgi:hypothetical protein
MTDTRRQLQQTYLLDNGRACRLEDSDLQRGLPDRLLQYEVAEMMPLSHPGPAIDVEA